MFLFQLRMLVTRWDHRASTY